MILYKISKEWPMKETNKRPLLINWRVAGLLFYLFIFFGFIILSSFINLDDLWRLHLKNSGILTFLFFLFTAPYDFFVSWIKLHPDKYPLWNNILFVLVDLGLLSVLLFIFVVLGDILGRVVQKVKTKK